MGFVITVDSNNELQTVYMQKKYHQNIELLSKTLLFTYAINL